MSKFIYKVLKQWKEEAGVKSPVQFKYSSDGTLSIYTGYKDKFIGASGSLSSKYKTLFKNELSNFNSIKFVETDFLWV